MGLGGGGDVERPGGGRLPVDDEHLALVVVYPAPADVERPRRRLQVEASEAEASLGVLERPEPSHRPGLERERGDLAVGRVGRPFDEPAHAVEAVVGVVDVRLLGREVGMGHGTRMGETTPRHKVDKPYAGRP